MIRVVEILVAVNAACGIAAFLLARGAIKRIKRELGIDDAENPNQKELDRVRRSYRPETVSEWPYPEDADQGARNLEGGSE